MEHEDSSLVKKIITTLQSGEYLVFTGIVLVLFLLFPLSSNFVEHSKYIVIGVVSAVTLFIWSLLKIVEKPTRITVHPFFLVLLVYGGSIIASALFSSGNIWSQFVGLHGASLFLALTAIALINIVRPARKSHVMQFIAVLSLVLSTISLLQVIGIGPSRIVNLLFGWNTPDTLAFHLTGSGITTLSVLIPLGLGLVYESWQQRRNWSEHWLIPTSAAVTLFVIGLYLVSFFVFRKDTPVLLPFSTNWSIATDILKSGRTAVFGFGPERFQDAYTRLRPVTQNTSATWNVVFQTGSNTLLTQLVSIGALGAGAWLALFILAVRWVQKSGPTHKSLGVIVVSCFITQLFLPANYSLVTLQFLLLGLWVGNLKQEHHQAIRDIHLSLSTAHQGQDLPKWFTGSFKTIACLLAFGMASGILYFTTRFSLAEYWYMRSLQSASRNDGKAVYEQQAKALEAFPYQDQYHTSYAQTSFAIARAITEQQDITDAQKNTALQLLQQSINQSQQALMINPHRTSNSTTLASIYRALIGSITDADKWTVAAYAQAVETDPQNPLLRVDLGTLFFQLQNYPQANELFVQAIQLKPDLPVGYYQLALSLKEQKNYDQAIQAYQKVLTLIDVQSPEYSQVEDELGEVLEKAKKTKEETATTKPTESPTPVDLPAEVKNEQQILNQQPGVLDVTPEASGSADSR